MPFRDDVDALEARHTALDAEVLRQTAERDRARALLDEARARARLPVLDNIKVASPCTASWHLMKGDAQVRHCHDCNKSVYNLSEMTREDAQALLIAKEGKLCVRYFQRSDGTIITADCKIGVKRRRRRKLVAAGAVGLVAIGAMWNHLRAGKTDIMEESKHVMGDPSPQQMMGGVSYRPELEPPIAPVVLEHEVSTKK